VEIADFGAVGINSNPQLPAQGRIGLPACSVTAWLLRVTLPEQGRGLCAARFIRVGQPCAAWHRQDAYATLGSAHYRRARWSKLTFRLAEERNGSSR